MIDFDGTGVRKVVHQVAPHMRAHLKEGVWWNIQENQNEE